MLEMVVGVAVGVLILAAALFPVIDEATATNVTLTNDGYARYTSINADDADEVVIEWDYTNPKFIEVNGESMDISAYSGMWASIVFGEQWTVRYNYSTNSTQLQYFGQTNADFVYAYESSSLNLTVTLSSGTVTVTNGTLTKTATYTTAYYPDASGNMIMKKSNEKCYLLEDSSIIIANGMTYSNPYTIGVFFNGTIENGLSFELFRNLDDFTVSNVEAHYTTNNQYLGVIELSNVTFDLTPGENPAIVATYSYFLVPYQITAEKAVHADADTIELLETIPILITVGLIMGIVGVIAARRFE